MPAKNPKTKYVFITGGVVSGLGEGITTASLGRLLRSEGHRAIMQKLDPYINIDPGAMNPVQHGEAFVTDDGAEADLDLSHCECFIDENLTKNSSVTAGRVHWIVLSKERRGGFGGGTVQMIPHITNETKSRFHRNYATDEAEIVVIEVGGTVGDIESQPFLEAIRQFMHEAGPHNSMLIRVTLIPYLKVSGELRAGSIQASVKDLQEMGVQPDIIVYRPKHPLDDGVRNKISQFYNAPVIHVLQNLDVSVLYEAPLVMEQEHLAEAVCECLDLPCPKPGLSEWQGMMDARRRPQTGVAVALAGKYIQLHDAYISVVEALKHGGVTNHARVHIKQMDSETVTQKSVDDASQDVKGILASGGFGDWGIDGKIYAIQYVREHNLLFLGLCLGIQLSIVEFVRNVFGYKNVHSVELNSAIIHPAIHPMLDQDGIEDIDGALRLGSYPCILDKDSLAYQLYDTGTIREHHRHRYGVNNGFHDALTEHGMELSDLSPDNRTVKTIELPDHPRLVVTWAHPELKSRLNRPHPPSRGFAQAILKA